MSSATRGASALPRVIWRETTATHFPSPNGLYDESRAARHRHAWLQIGCKPLADAAPPDVIANVSTLLRTAGVTVIPAWSLTAPLAALHTWTHLPPRPTDSLDCVHFCVWTRNGAYELMLGALADAIGIAD